MTDFVLHVPDDDWLLSSAACVLCYLHASEPGRNNAQKHRAPQRTERVNGRSAFTWLRGFSGSAVFARADGHMQTVLPRRYIPLNQGSVDFSEHVISGLNTVLLRAVDLCRTAGPSLPQRPLNLGSA